MKRLNRMAQGNTVSKSDPSKLHIPNLESGNVQQRRAFLNNALGKLRPIGAMDEHSAHSRRNRKALEEDVEEEEEEAADVDDEQEQKVLKEASLARGDENQDAPPPSYEEFMTVMRASANLQHSRTESNMSTMSQESQPGAAGERSTRASMCVCILICFVCFVLFVCLFVCWLVECLFFFHNTSYCNSTFTQH